MQPRRQRYCGDLHRAGAERAVGRCESEDRCGCQPALRRSYFHISCSSASGPSRSISLTPDRPSSAPPSSSVQSQTSFWSSPAVQSRPSRSCIPPRPVMVGCGQASALSTVQVVGSVVASGGGIFRVMWVSRSRPHSDCSQPSYASHSHWHAMQFAVPGTFQKYGGSLERYGGGLAAQPVSSGPSPRPSRLQPAHLAPS